MVLERSVGYRPSGVHRLLGLGRKEVLVREQDAGNGNYGGIVAIGLRSSRV